MQLVERDARIVELEMQVAKAAQSAEVAEALRAEIEKVRQEAADQRVEFELKQAGVCNVKTARALLADHEGDLAKLKEAEPRLFEDVSVQPRQTGKTGLPNAGAQMKRWRKIAGLEDTGR